MMYRFYLLRFEDPSGVSGVGRVAEGIEFSDGTCAMRWMPQPGVLNTSTGFYDSMDVLVRVHGHGGKTRVDYVDVP